EAEAGTPRLVLDINSFAGPVDSNPSALGKLGDIALLRAQSAPGGPALLIRSDGTAAGTSTLKSFNGTGPSTLPTGTVGATPTFLQIGSQAYFIAHESSTGNELWVTDGTANGTHLVAEVNPGNTGDAPHLLGAFNGGLAFAAHDADFV